MFATRGDGDDETVVHEDYLELVVIAPEVAEEDSTEFESFLNTILSTLLQDPYLEPAPEPSYVFEDASEVKVLLGNPVDP